MYVMALASYSINFWAVLLSAVVAFIIGGLFYGPVFGKILMKLSRVSKKDIKKTSKSEIVRNYIFTFISSIILIYILAFFLMVAGASSIGDAVVISILAWLGFVLTINLSQVLWSKKPAALYLLDNL